jgi:hypothetical protein
VAIIGSVGKSCSNRSRKKLSSKNFRSNAGAGVAATFFYLALQESNFDIYSVGPKTYKGHAKGMWQFIPETAIKYGLRIGPLVDSGRPDPRDERHNFRKGHKRRCPLPQVYL